MSDAEKLKSKGDFDGARASLATAKGHFPHEESVAKLEKEIAIYRKGLALGKSGKHKQAMELFHQLEGSPHAQMQVRAKFQVGELFYSQGEFDLALQVYEEIVGSYAFSGIVIKTLQRLVDCTQKLNLSEKKDRYHSMLSNVFKQG